MNPREKLNARVAEIERKYPEDELAGPAALVRYGSQANAQRAKAEKNRLIAEAKEEAKQEAAKLAAKASKRAAEYEMGTGRTKDVDHGAVATVRSLLERGASVSKLTEQFKGSERELRALRFLVETDDLGGSSTSEEQVRQRRGYDSGDEQGKRRTLHAIDKVLYPEWAEEAERAADDDIFYGALAQGADTTTAVQMAQLKSPKHRGRVK